MKKQKKPCCVDVGMNASVQTMLSSMLKEVLSISFEREMFFPNEKDCLKSINKKNGLLFNEKHIAMDVETDWWCEYPSISFEEKGMSPNEGNGLKSLDTKI